MSNDYWHSGIDPKVVGSWNLHNAIKGKDSELDFFLMTSSILGSVGAGTESNYCSANYFLDTFARHRQSLGLPAMAVGLGLITEVGYLHENPDIQALLVRKGIQAIGEDELIQIFDIALSTSLNIPHAYDSAAQSHILTGLEPFGFMELRKKGFKVTIPTLDDPRASILARALDTQSDLRLEGQSGDPLADVMKSLEDGTLAGGIAAQISTRLSDLVFLPLTKVDIKKPLVEYGMDSIIAGQFRTWFFKTFKVDIPFLELFSKTVTVSSLSDAVLTKLKSKT
jgi:KR domain/Phosphopantetheine attachment site